MEDSAAPAPAGYHQNAVAPQNRPHPPSPDAAIPVPFEEGDSEDAPAWFEGRRCTHPLER